MTNASTAARCGVESPNTTGSGADAAPGSRVVGRARCEYPILHAVPPLPDGSRCWTGVVLGKGESLRGFRTVLEWGIADEIADLPEGPTTYRALCMMRAAWLRDVRGWDAVCHGDSTGRFCCVCVLNEGVSE